jgi:hypothetical protein
LRLGQHLLHILQVLICFLSQSGKTNEDPHNLHNIMKNLRVPGSENIYAKIAKVGKWSVIAGIKIRKTSLIVNRAAQRSFPASNQRRLPASGAESSSVLMMRSGACVKRIAPLTFVHSASVAPAASRSL